METSSRTLQNLPLEMLDMILMKTVAKIVRSAWEDSAYQIQTSTYKHLGTVWSAWHNRLTTRWFRIVLQRKLQRYSPLTKYREKPELLKTIDIGCKVWGLAMLNKELFVASLHAEVLFVYDSVAFTRLREIGVKGLTSPRDIAACQQKNRLFLVNEVLSNSSLFSIDRKGKLLKRWKLPSRPRNLSLMPSGDILLMCNAGILIYTSNGNIVQELRLDAVAHDMSWQTILLSSGNYLVCQGWLSSIHHRVVSLSPEGTILKSFGGEKQRSDDHLHDPVYMAMDRDELIFVADSGNNRVVLLNRGLVFLKELLSEKDGVIEPYRVLLDEASGLLYVGSNDLQLLVFKVFK